jgi:hypothetical protein
MIVLLPLNGPPAVIECTIATSDFGEGGESAEPALAKSAPSC